MKKILLPLAILTAAVLFTGCRAQPAHDIPAAGYTTQIATTQDETITLPEEATEQAQATTLPAEALPPIDTSALPDNLHELSEAAQLHVFNQAANDVRLERPAFSRRSRMVMGRVSATGMAGLAMPALNPILQQQLPPAEWVTTRISRGQNNAGEFFSAGTNASELTMDDIEAIETVRSGQGWVITVHVREERNDRVQVTMTPQQVIDQTLGGVEFVQVSAQNTSLRHHGGFATIMLNEQGQVMEARSGFVVSAQARDVVLGPMRADAALSYTVRHYYTNFDW
ncbi:MAG: alpha/beta hydrolase family protein [Oscillospiraceae bacterium]|nr:alpha/beta hydrolase family protein [Oscillospiraceae bacterium]